MKHIRKMFTALIGTTLTGLAAAMVVGPANEGFAGISQAELFSALASAVVVALGVYIIPNSPTPDAVHKGENQ